MQTGIMSAYTEEAANQTLFEKRIERLIPIRV